jgi:pyrrolysine biosynthesis protein PylD
VTRLTAADVAGVGADWPAFEARLRDLTGTGLLGLAASTLDLPPGPAASAMSDQLVAVVPDDSGGGLIEGFGEALAETARHLGARAFLTAPGDFAAARSGRATMTLSAGDDDFLAVSLTSGRVSENGQATGRIYAEALRLMAGGLIASRRVLVIGAGPVGRAAAGHLVRRGAAPIFFDLDPAKAARAAGQIPGAAAWTPAAGRAPEDFDLFVEASTAASLWPSLPRGALVSAPGMPRALLESPLVRQWHEPLATGTAMMILEAAWAPG